MIRYAYALDAEGNAVHIEDAIPKKEYFCPDCDSGMIPKNQGKDKEHHYAHKNIGFHTGVSESPLHSDTKWFIHNLIKSALANGDTTHTDAKCSKQDDCHVYYTKIPYGINETPNPRIGFYPHGFVVKPINKHFDYFLTNDIDGVVAEKQEEGFIPDVSLTKKGKLVKAIEIVHTHEDSEEKIQFYKDNGIDVIYIYVKSVQDFQEIQKMHQYLPSKFTELTINRSGGCRMPLITTNEMLIDNLTMREKIKYIEIILEEIGWVSAEMCSLENDGRIWIMENAKLHNEIRSLIESRKENLLKTFESYDSFRQLMNSIDRHQEVYILNFYQKKQESIRNAIVDNILNEIKSKKYDSTWTIAGICRNCDGTSFYSKIQIFYRLMEHGYIVRNENGYQICTPNVLL